MLEVARKEKDRRERDIIEVQSEDDRKPELRKEEPDERPSEDGTSKARDKQEDQKEDDEGGGLWDRLRQHKIALGLAALILIVGAVGALLWYLHARNYVSTDDAFIDGHPVFVSPEVTGNIVAVPVTDNQLVRAGDLLVSIDPRNYVAAVQQAKAQIEEAQASIAVSSAQIEAQKAQVAQTEKQIVEAKAALSFAQAQNTRAQKLVKSGFGTVQNAQQTSSDLRSKQAALDVAVAANSAAKRQISVLEAQAEQGEGRLQQAQAEKTTAEANLSRTQIHATVGGRVTQLTAAIGSAATPGQALMVVVPTHLWVTANFKETALAKVRPGQAVAIEIDAYGKTYRGHVNSVQAGSGTAFSLLPAENATGNYVKVVQRIPVKITFDKLPDVEIGPGMSVVPTVTVR